MFAMAQVWNLPGPDRPGYWQRPGRAGMFLLVLGGGVIITALLTSFGTWGSSSLGYTVLAEAPARRRARRARPDGTRGRRTQRVAAAPPPPLTAVVRCSQKLREPSGGVAERMIVAMLACSGV
jgi:hypothetical protein